MKRRDFFAKFTRGSGTPGQYSVKSGKPRVQAGLEERTSPLTLKEALHLLRRITFAPPIQLAKQLVGKTPSEAVELVLGDSSYTPPPPPDWTDIVEPNPLKVGNPTLKNEIESRLRNRYGDFCAWWLNLMRSDGFPVREKITLFLTTVWCIEFTYDTLALIPPPLCHKNNETLRKNRLGNYKTIAEEMTLDGAMLLYQSLFYSTKDAPNENYQRELLELFTMGTGNIFTGDANYTEGDIREGSRALTGWRVNAYEEKTGPGDYFETFFNPDVHDIGAKEFMGNSIPARDSESNTEELVREEEVGGILDIMFSERADAIANFISEKIYRYFVYSNSGSGDEGIIKDIAVVLKNNSFELKPVFVTLLKSEHFYQPDNIGVQIKTPPEFLVGLERQLGVDLGNTANEVKAVFNLEQVLYDPPNVGSWDGYRQWISTMTFPLRVKYAKDLIARASAQLLVNLAKEFENYDNAESLTENLITYFFPVDFSQDRIETYKGILLDGAGVSESNWADTINDSNPDAAGKGIEELIAAFTKAPDFQLC